MQLIAARYVRTPLDPGSVRDIKLVVFLLEVDSGRLARGLNSGPAGVLYNTLTAGRLADLGGISRERLTAAITRLVEAGALLVEDGADPRLVFAERVLRPAGANEHVDWLSVLTRLQGQTTALLLIQAVLEMMRVPWEWVALPYEMLAERAYYSLGMVRHGMQQLLAAGILERSSHSGRSHEYRCSSVVLHGGLRYTEPVSGDARMVSTPLADVPTRSPSRPAASPPPSVQAGGSASIPGSQAAMVVEIGGLVLRLPEGTVISMGVDGDGAAVYQIGPHLRIKSP